MNRKMDPTQCEELTTLREKIVNTKEKTLEGMFDLRPPTGMAMNIIARAYYVREHNKLIRDCDEMLQYYCSQSSSIKKWNHKVLYGPNHYCSKMNTKCKEITDLREKILKQKELNETGLLFSSFLIKTPAGMVADIVSSAYYHRSSNKLIRDCDEMLKKYCSQSSNSNGWSLKNTKSRDT